MPGRLARDIKQSKPFFSTRLEVYFNLLRATDLLSRHTSELLKPFDLSGPQYNVLRILRGAAGADPSGTTQVGSNPGGSNLVRALPCKEIGARLIAHDPDITRLLDRLEKRGLVQRTPGQADRRVRLVQITAAGSALVESCDLDRRLTEALAPHFSAFSAPDHQTLISLLEHLSHA